MVDTSVSEIVAGSSADGSADLKNPQLKKCAERDDMNDGLDDRVAGDPAIAKGEVAAGLIEATRAIGTVLSAGLPALAFAGKPTLSCPHPKIKLVAENVEGTGRATTTPKGVKPKVSKKQAEKAAKESAEKDAEKKAKRDLQIQQDGVSCAGKCKKVRGEPKVKISKGGKGTIVDEKDNPRNDTTTFTAKATAEGSATVQCK